jgi:hypothetical protein
VNRTLRPGADLEKVKAGIENYRRFRALFSQLVEQEEEQVLSLDRALAAEGKRDSKYCITYAAANKYQ